MNDDKNYCQCEKPLVLMGSFICDKCNKQNKNVIEVYNKYHCPKCKRTLGHSQQSHDLTFHKFG